MRNLNKPNRYNVASIQAQQTMGGDVMQSDEEGQYVEFRDYAWLLVEKQRLDTEVNGIYYTGLAVSMLREQLANKCQDNFEIRKAHQASIQMIRDLQAEVERLKEGNDCLGQMHDKEMERSAYLCEQVERLEKGIQPEGSNDAVGRAVNVLLEKQKEIANLKAEVERLRKAGDAVCESPYALETDPAVIEWRAAKEGKQS